MFTFFLTSQRKGNTQGSFPQLSSLLISLHIGGLHRTDWSQSRCVFVPPMIETVKKLRKRQNESNETQIWQPGVKNVRNKRVHHTRLCNSKGVHVLSHPFVCYVGVFCFCRHRNTCRVKRLNMKYWILANRQTEKESDIEISKKFSWKQGRRQFQDMSFLKSSKQWIEISIQHIRTVLNALQSV